MHAEQKTTRSHATKSTSERCIGAQEDNKNTYSEHNRKSDATDSECANQDHVNPHVNDETRAVLI